MKHSKPQSEHTCAQFEEEG